MTISLPNIYNLRIENLRRKIKFYDSIGLHSLAVMEPKQLMQSTRLSYARYMFYKENGINIDETNYRKLFVDQKTFERQYGIKKLELLKKYPYEEEKNSGSKPEDDKEALIDSIIRKQKFVAEQEQEISKLQDRKNEDKGTKEQE